MSSLRKSVLGKGVKRGLGQPTENYSPTKWSQYFDTEESVATANGTFHVYRKGDAGPKLVCLHGGGYSGLTWALFAVDIFETIECEVITIDLRGHGNSKVEDETDLSLDNLSNDVVDVLKVLFKEEMPPIVLVGHSMGGSVAVQCCYLLETVVGLCVIDVVEGTALDALSSMQSILRGRPTQFKSIQHAIQWCCKSGQTYNSEAAKVSMPGQIMNEETQNLAANECDSIRLHEATEFSKPFKRELATAPGTISEDDEEGTSDFSKPPLPPSIGRKADPPEVEAGPKYVWRIDLSKTEQFWGGWFKGLSQKFLDTRMPKLLLLANIHGLDTTLTVGQMQGKFQLQVMSKSGHAIHEDQPQRVADIIGSYLVKQRITTAKGVMIPSMPGC